MSSKEWKHSAVRKLDGNIIPRSVLHDDSGNVVSFWKFIHFLEWRATVFLRAEPKRTEHSTVSEWHGNILSLSFVRGFDKSGQCLKIHPFPQERIHRVFRTGLERMNPLHNLRTAWKQPLSLSVLHEDSRNVVIFIKCIGFNKKGATVFSGPMLRERIRFAVQEWHGNYLSRSVSHESSRNGVRYSKFIWFLEERSHRTFQTGLKRKKLATVSKWHGNIHSRSGLH